MKKPSVITVPNLQLREVTNKVTSFDKQLNEKITNMVTILRDEGGIGLAANQIGYKDKIIVAEFKDPDGKEHIPLSVFINPEIVEYSKDIVCLEEGCLSVPKIEIEVDRPDTLKIKYQDQTGKKLKSAPKGLIARILQHEIDHLNGIVFTDRVKDQLFKKHPEIKNTHLVFVGSGEFAAIILEGLLLLGLKLDVFTEESKEGGRNKEIIETPVSQTATKFGHYITYVESVPDLENLVPDNDLLICSDFGHKLSPKVLSKSKVSAINLHPSILPKFQGPTPIQAAILEGAKHTGVSIIKMTEKIDQGPIYSQIETEVLDIDTYPLLRDRLATLGLKLLLKTLPALIENKLEPLNQPLEKATFTKKITKENGEIDWRKSNKKIERQIRAYFPWPGSYTYLEGKRFIIWSAHLVDDKIFLEIVQMEGKKPLQFKEFLRGFKGKKPSWFKRLASI